MASDTREIKALPKDVEEIPEAKLIFFCKNCEEVVDAKQTKKKFTFRCPKCAKTEIAFGTEESIRNHYRF
ncbi:MAG: hypothetical protein ABIH35_02895 [Patescibacteria group bacterium]